MPKIRFVVDEHPITIDLREQEQSLKCVLDDINKEIDDPKSYLDTGKIDTIIIKLKR